MDALIRVMVGAAALCAASIAYAGPVVVDGDPDEPDIGGEAVEPVIPHRVNPLDQRSNTRDKTPAQSSYNPISRPTKAYTTNTVTTVVCPIKHYLASSHLENVKILDSGEVWTVSFDISRRLYKIWGNGDDRFIGDISKISQEQLTLVWKRGSEIDLDRATGKIRYIQNTDGFYSFYAGDCEKTATRPIELGPITKF